MVKKNQALNIIVAGVGGQGSILASHIIADAAVKAGHKARVGETFGAAMRGGAVHSHIRIGKHVEGPLVRENTLDILLGLEPNEALRLGVKYLAPYSISLVNTSPIYSTDVNIGASKYEDPEKIVLSLKKLCEKVVAFDATKFALDIGNIRTMNIIMIGALAATGKLPFPIEVLKQAIKERVPKHTIDLNLEAFELGIKQYTQ